VVDGVIGFKKFGSLKRETTLIKGLVA